MDAGIFQKEKKKQRECFLELTTLSKNRTAPLIIMAASVQKFPLSLFSVQLLPVGVLEMTSAERERRVSPSLLRVSVCCHGSSCHFLPEWVFLCSFIFVCTLKRSHSVLCLHCHIWVFFYQQRAQGFPRCRKNLHELIHKHICVCTTCACMHNPTRTHTHTRESARAAAF